MFEEYEVVRLKKNLEKFGLRPGALGTILIVHAANPPAYEVEFCDEEGQTIALLTLTENEIMKM